MKLTVKIEEPIAADLSRRLSALARDPAGLRLHGLAFDDVDQLADVLRSVPKDGRYAIDVHMVDVVLDELGKARETALRQMNRASTAEHHDGTPLASYSAICQTMRTIRIWRASSANTRPQDCPPCTQDCDQGKRCPAWTNTLLTVYLGRMLPRSKALVFCAVLASALVVAAVL